MAHLNLPHDEYQQQIITEGGAGPRNMAMEVARKALPLHPHKFAPKKFNEHQLFACLVLMRFFKTSYRGIHAYLQDIPTLCEDLGLWQVPHYTTIQQAAWGCIAG